MRLRDITIRGFKSFAPTTTFQIDEGLTAVIGPNGSGKSNFTEAIRWVLGEQSMKSLRGRKSEDLIFAGSAAHKRAGAATVTLTFSNEEGRLPLPSPEVALTRRLTRTGESEYLLNGDPVRLLDVQQLLAEAGMGTKSYTVISQGMVDRYLTASPAARRELFDEACGIKPLQLKVARAQRQLSQARTETQALQVVLQELAPRLRLLRRQAARQQERSALEQEFQTLQAQWLHHTWRARQAELAHAEARVGSTRQARARARQERDAVEQELLAWAHQPHSAEDAQQAELRQQVAQAEAEYGRLTAQFAAQQKEQEELATSLQTIRVQLARAEAALVQARAATEDHTPLKKVSRVLQRCAAVLTVLSEGRLPTEKEIAALRADIAAALTETASEAGMVTSAQTFLEKLEGPLQAVARLRALAHDREARLAHFTTLSAPSPAALHTAQAALKAHVGAAAPTAASHEQRLVSARERELAAERAASTTESAHEHLRHEMEELRGVVLREQGSEFLAYITNTPAAGACPLRSEVDGVAARLAAVGDIDPLVIKEYEEVDARYTSVSEQLQDIEATASKIQRLITAVTQEMHTAFRQQFAIITRAFAQYFSRLFEGGEAQLKIVDATPDGTDPAATPQEEQLPVEGVEIFVHPPGKKLQHVQLLSGGEKALTSLALLLAILEVQQPPFLVLDEVDAALDEANSHRFAALLKEKSAATQCIVVSHNRETMAQADILYGITMQQAGVSRVYSVKLHELVGDASPEEINV